MAPQPRHPIGASHGKDFTSEDVPWGLKIGIITRVDEINMKADVRVLTGGGDRFELDLTQGMCGPRSFWGGVPEKNATVILGYRRVHKQLYDAMILGYIPVGNKSGLRFDPFSPVRPSDLTTAEDKADAAKTFGPTFRYKRLKIRPGDCGGMSSSGSEFVLSKDVRMCNRAGDLIELRDSERSIVMQAVHKVDSVSGVFKLSGPIRRGSFWLPLDIFKADGRTLRDDTTRYYGRDELESAGPNPNRGGKYNYASTSGVIQDVINDSVNFPPITLANGRRYHYTPTMPDVSVEDPDGGAYAYVEDRVELFHTSDLTQEVRNEIDGFQMDYRRAVYIERVMGSIIGNDAISTVGQRQYGKVLKPKVFSNFRESDGMFTLEEVPRMPDLESITTAGAYMLRIRPPRGVDKQQCVFAISKQGKVFADIPGSGVEDPGYGAKNVSADILLRGALKMSVGAASPDNTSIQLDCVGGILLNIGHFTDGPYAGKGIQLNSKCAFGMVCEGGGGSGEDGNTAYSLQTMGDAEFAYSGEVRELVHAAKKTTVSGAAQLECDRNLINAHSGFTLNCGEINTLASGKSQYQYAQMVTETVVTGGKLSTVMAGALVQNVSAGAATYNTLAGATLFNNPAGAFTITVGAGAISTTTGSGAIALSTGAGAMSLAAGAGAVSVVAGLALSLTSGVMCSILAPQIMLGGPAAVLGVARGTPMMPPGMPSLDWITGMPLQGSAMVRSI